jgi:hypothetical protein
MGHMLVLKIVQRTMVHHYAVASVFIGVSE